MSRVDVETNIPKAVSKSQLVIEAIVENVEAKRELFATVESSTDEYETLSRAFSYCCLLRKCLLATNTSSLSLRDISLNMKHKHRFGGLHFFNPVPVMQLLEVKMCENMRKATHKRLGSA